MGVVVMVTRLEVLWTFACPSQVHLWNNRRDLHLAALKQRSRTTLKSSLSNPPFSNKANMIGPGVNPS